MSSIVYSARLLSTFLYHVDNHCSPVLTCLYSVVVRVFHYTYYTETWVAFNTQSLRDEYNKQGLQHRPDTGRLTKCRSYNQRTQCDTITYKHPFNQTNHRQSALLSNDKASTSRLLTMNGIRCPRFARFDKLPTLDECTRILRAYGVRFPAVVKPIDGTQGYGVHLNVRDCKEVVKIVHKLRAVGRKRIIVEEQVTGENYRVFVYNGRVFDIVQRELASVVGDGRHTLDQLIQERNRRQRAQKLFATHNVNWTYIHEQVPSVPEARLPKFVVPQGKRILITNIANFHNGCNVRRIPLDQVTPRTKAHFVKVNRVLGLQMSGIDYMSKDIRSMAPNAGWVIEVNAGPDLKIHQDALPRDERLTGRFVRGLFA